MKIKIYTFQYVTYDDFVSRILAAKLWSKINSGAYFCIQIICFFMEIKEKCKRIIM